MTKLKGGIIIIGSLLWDTSKTRVSWRNKSLMPLDRGIDVHMPIRYGRISKTRNYTYSMVFSNDCEKSHKQGNAKFIEFNNNPVTLDELWTQCTELIKAETNKEMLSFSTFNWKWGALGLCINPKTEIDKKEVVHRLKESWKNKYGIKKPLIPIDYEVNNEGLIINDSGILNIQWAKELEKYDFFIATATKPEQSIYPNPYKIAEKMILNEDDSYFRHNQLNNIITFQDEDIITELKKIDDNWTI